MEFGLLNGGVGEHSGVSFVRISEIFAMRDAFLLGTIPSDCVLQPTGPTLHVDYKPR